MKIILKTNTPGTCEESRCFATIDEKMIVPHVSYGESVIIEMSEGQAHELRKWLEKHLLGVTVESC